jgi:hypothetical protein
MCKDDMTIAKGIEGRVQKKQAEHEHKRVVTSMNWLRMQCGNEGIECASDMKCEQNKLIAKIEWK